MLFNAQKTHKITKPFAKWRIYGIIVLILRRDYGTAR